MAGGPNGPGANSRGRGGKFRKFTRGGMSVCLKNHYCRLLYVYPPILVVNPAPSTGGKHFSRDLRPLDADGNEISMWAADGQKKKNQGGSSDEEEDSEEESSEEESDDAGPSNAQAEVSREDRKKEKAARKAAAIAKAKAASIQVGDLPPSDDEESSDDDMPANPNHSKAARKQAVAAPKPIAEVEEVTEGVKKVNLEPQSRKERESLEAAQAKERYRKLHEAGKTDEAKADMARLRLIREKREAEAARKQVRTSRSRSRRYTY